MAWRLAWHQSRTCLPTWAKTTLRRCKREIFVKLNKSSGNCSGWLPEHDLTWCIMLVSWHVLRTDEQDMWSSLEMSY